MFRIKMLAFVPTSLVIGAVLGCSTYTPMVWKNASISDAQAQQQFLIDDGKCVSEASNAVQIPQAPPQGDSINIYQQQGTNQPTLNRTNVAQQMAYMQEMGEKGAMQGRISNAQQSRQRVYKGCMASHGWLQVEASH